MSQNGQELQTGDVNNMGQAALMDDRVLAEVLRMLPNEGGSVSKLVLSYGVDAAGTELTDYSDATVFTKQSADAKVYIAPFRAVVGSRTASSADGLKAWRDIRSGVCVAGKGVWSSSLASSLAIAQVIAANSSGNARWDVIYAIITPDTNQTSVARAVKSASTGTVTTPNTVVQLACQVSLGYTQGTAAASPAFPAIPTDSGGNYYVALAYVLVPNGFNATSTVKPWMICPAAPAPIALSKGLGGCNAMPANQQNISGGQVVFSTSVSSWANNSTTSISGRPAAFLPPSMIGMETVWAAFDLSGTSSSGWSHQNGSFVDTSRDWRNRLFRVFWTASIDSASNGHFAWDRGGSAVLFCPRPPVTAGTIATGAYFYQDMGQSFIADGNQLTGGGPIASSSIVSAVGHSQLSTMDSGITGSIAALYVDQSTGHLCLYLNSTGVDCHLMAWIDASRPFTNY